MYKTNRVPMSEDYRVNKDDLFTNQKNTKYPTQKFAKMNYKININRTIAGSVYIITTVIS